MDSYSSHSLGQGFFTQRDVSEIETLTVLPVVDCLSWLRSVSFRAVPIGMSLCVFTDIWIISNLVL